MTPSSDPDSPGATRSLPASPYRGKPRRSFSVESTATSYEVSLVPAAVPSSNSPGSGEGSPLGLLQRGSDPDAEESEIRRDCAALQEQGVLTKDQARVAAMVQLACCRFCSLLTDHALEALVSAAPDDPCMCFPFCCCCGYTKLVGPAEPPMGFADP